MRISVLTLIIMHSCVLHLASVHGQAAADNAELIPFFIPAQSTDLENKIEDLAAALTAQGLSQVRPIAVQNWNDYQRAIRHGQSGVYLAAPHYSAWAVIRHNFVPLFRLVEPLQYVIVVRKEESQLFEISDLDKKRICTQKQLNLDYLLANKAFDNPLLSADIISVRSVEKELIENNRRCVGFVVSVGRLTSISARLPQQLIRLRQSPQYNNYSILANPGTAQKTLDQLAQFIATKQGQRLLEPILLQFSSRSVLGSVSYENYQESEFSPLLRYWGN